MFSDKRLINTNTIDDDKFLYVGWLGSIYNKMAKFSDWSWPILIMSSVLQEKSMEACTRPAYAGERRENTRRPLYEN
jgi:hypothetical protein